MTGLLERHVKALLDRIKQSGEAPQVYEIESIEEWCMLRDDLELYLRQMDEWTGSHVTRNLGVRNFLLLGVPVVVAP